MYVSSPATTRSELLTSVRSSTWANARIAADLDVQAPPPFLDVAREKSLTTLRGNARFAATGRSSPVAA